MNIIQELLVLLQLDTELDKGVIKSKLEILGNDISSMSARYDTQINELNSKLASKDSELSSIRSALGVEDGITLNTEAIKAKMNDSKDISKVEEKYNEIITNLNVKFEQDKQELLNKLEEEKKKAKDLNLQNKISSIIPNIDAQDGALDDIINLLKDGADFNNLNEIIYKQGDTIRRNEKGFELSLKDRLAELESQKPYLFKPKVENGSGVGGNTSNFSNGVVGKQRSLFEQRMLDRRKQIGL